MKNIETVPVEQRHVAPEEEVAKWAVPKEMATQGDYLVSVDEGGIWCVRFIK